jgi:pyruvate kinase
VSDSSCAPPWDTHVLAELIDEFAAIRASCLEIERAFDADLRDVHPTYRDSASNLLHYVGLRRGDIRALQKRLASRWGCHRSGVPSRTYSTT